MRAVAACRTAEKRTKGMGVRMIGQELVVNGSLVAAVVLLSIAVIGLLAYILHNHG